MKYVAFLDILGFKNTLRNLKHSGAKSYIVKFSLEIYNEWKRNNKNSLDGYVISDSLIINSKDVSEKSLHDIINVTYEICRKEFIKNGILLRGGIAKGDFDKLNAESIDSLQKGLIVGQAYVDAYLLEGSNKLIGISMSKDVYSDICNFDFFNRDIVAEDDKYILRYIDIKLLMNPDNLYEFIKSAKESKWKPHYYNTIYFAIKGEKSKSSIDLVFSNIINAVCNYKPGENWRDIDNFIKNAFSENVMPGFQTRFLKYLRKKIIKSNEEISNNFIL